MADKIETVTYKNVSTGLTFEVEKGGSEDTIWADQAEMQIVSSEDQPQAEAAEAEEDQPTKKKKRGKA